jgi:hypothetical protein
VIVKGGFVLSKPRQTSDLDKDLDVNTIHLVAYQQILMEEQTLMEFTQQAMLL